MDIITYLEKELGLLAKDFPTLKIRVGEDNLLTDCIIVELSDFDSPEIDSRWIPISIACLRDPDNTKQIVFTGMEKKEYLNITTELFKFNI